MKTRYKKSEDIRELLLDSAESLFAERGYFGVSIRDITDFAGVRSASVNYHFETKENLFSEVINRRAKPLASARLEALTEVQIEVGKPVEVVTNIVKAFTEPMMKFSASGGQGWKNYCTLIAHLGVQKIWTDNAVSAKYDKHALQFVGALQQALPNASSYQIHCCFQFMLSTTLYAVCDNKRIDTLSKGKYRSGDLENLERPLLKFIVDGILGVAGLTP